VALLSFVTLQCKLTPHPIRLSVISKPSEQSEALILWFLVYNPSHLRSNSLRDPRTVRYLRHFSRIPKVSSWLNLDLALHAIAHRDVPAWRGRRLVSMGPKAYTSKAPPT